MAVPKVTIDNSRLLKRMRKYEQVTGKAIGNTLRRNARLMAVSLARSTAPYGIGSDAKRLGERAVQNDIMRVYRPAYKISLKYQYTKWSFASLIHNSLTQDSTLRSSILQILGESVKQGKSKKAIAARSGNIAALNEILRNTTGFSKIYAKESVDASFHKRSRNNYGRVRKNWQSNEVITNKKSLQSYIKERQARVGMTKAAWAAAAIKVNADVKDALSGIPAWVKRHLSKVPAAVIDNAESIAPHIKLTNKLPWASNALRKNDMEEALRIGRQKFYRSMGREIREVLKKAGKSPF